MTSRAVLTPVLGTPTHVHDDEEMVHVHPFDLQTALIDSWSHRSLPAT